MADQAEVLRSMAQGRGPARSSTDAAAKPAARVVSVTSGKGGVGKTNFVCAVAVGLARLGKSVVVIDADLGLANVDVLLGLSPQYNLRHVITGERTLQEVTVTGPQGVKLIPGASGIQAMADLPESRRSHFLSAIGELEALNDFILIDTGAGISSRVLDFVMAASEIIVVTTPEPPAIADAYAMIKIVAKRGMSERVRLVVNMANSEREAIAVSEHLRKVVHEFLHARLDVLGYMLLDRYVPMSVREQSSFLVKYPACPASLAVMRMCRDLLDESEPEGQLNKRQPQGFRGFLTRLFERSLDGGDGSQ